MKVSDYEALLSLCNECIRLQKDLTTAEAKRCVVPRGTFTFGKEDFTFHTDLRRRGWGSLVWLLQFRLRLLPGSCCGVP